MRRIVSIFSRFDWMLLLAATALTVIGLLAIYGIGISHGTVNLFQFKKQLVALAIGEVLAVGLAFFDYRHLRSPSLPLYIGGIVMLIAVLLFGTTARNAGRWFVMGAISFQPVELAKVLLVIFLASYLARRLHQRLTWIELSGSLVAMLVMMVLVILQPDFGSAMVFVALWVGIVVFCRLPRHAWWIGLLTLSVAATSLWTFGLRPYQRDRIMSFLDPSRDPYGAAYNVAQARIAIGSGGWLGKGIGEGSQARLRFLPEASTDFMFAVLGEELGFIGLLVVLGLFFFFLYRCLRIAQRADEPFAAILLIGCISIMLFHVMVNAGMNLGLLPVTGIPLPFASAAASSLVTVFLMVGLAESIAVHTRDS